MNVRLRAGRATIWIKNILVAVESGVDAIALPPQSKIAVGFTKIHKVSHDFPRFPITFKKNKNF
jgi:hypothetical protein